MQRKKVYRNFYGLLKDESTHCPNFQHTNDHLMKVSSYTNKGRSAAEERDVNVVVEVSNDG